MKKNWMIWYATCLHTMWGFTMLFDPPRGGDANGGVLWNVYVENGGVFFWAVWMLVAAAFSVVSLSLRREGWLKLLLLLPQQAVLTIGMLGPFMNLLGMSEATFETSRAFRNIAPTLFGFLFHTAAILEHHAEGVWGKLCRKLL